MKPRVLLLSYAGAMLALVLTVRAQDEAPPPPSPPEMTEAAMPGPPPAESETPVAAPTSDAGATNAPATAETESETEEPAVAAKPATPEPPATFAPPATPVAGDRELRLNFRNAPIEMVLSYLSDAAGFIIELNTPVRGKVDVWSSQPVSKEEAVDLLNSVLNKNGYAAIRNGRRLTIVTKEDALRADIPVKLGGDPDAIPRNDELVTQIIPVRYVEAQQLVKDLGPMISVQRIVANEAGNSIAVTDTQANIRHLVEIIRAIDNSAEDVTELRVFRLEHADPTEMANLLNGLFTQQGGASQAQTPVQFGGRFGGFPGAFGPGGGRGATPATTVSAQSQRIRKRQQVVAVADARTGSVVVTATKDLMNQIADMIEELDHHSPKQATVQVFRLENADPQQVLPVLQDMFQTTTSTRSSRGTSQQNSPLMNRVQQSQSSSLSQGSSIGSGLGGNTRLNNQGQQY
jgi:hypothetical protein